MSTNLGWQPIATAPKDGSTVILWIKYGTVPVVAYWNSKCCCWQAETEYYDVYGGGYVISESLEDATHWMECKRPEEDDE